MDTALAAVVVAGINTIGLIVITIMQVMAAKRAQEMKIQLNGNLDKMLHMSKAAGKAEGKLEIIGVASNGIRSGSATIENEEAGGEGEKTEETHA